VTSLRKPDACRTLATWSRPEDAEGDTSPRPLNGNAVAAAGSAGIDRAEAACEHRPARLTVAKNVEHPMLPESGLREASTTKRELDPRDLSPDFER
jgi:hypothetical protein